MLSGQMLRPVQRYSINPQPTSAASHLVCLHACLEGFNGPAVIQSAQD